jgi:hypothetical protein
MKRVPLTAGPLVGLGMASLVLGTVGLLLTIFPVLGIPLTLFGLLCGIIGLVLAIPGDGSELRWSLAGIGMCAVVLALNIAIVIAPSSYLPGRKVPELWRQDKDRPYVPPPG